MKKTLLNLLFISLLYFATGCSKDSLADSSILEGKWKLKEVYWSDGSPGKWTSVPKKEQGYVFFSHDGLFESTVFSDYTSYAIRDSVTIVLTKNDKSIQNFRYELKDGMLTMIPNGPVWCIEGCGNKFAKLEDLTTGGQ